MDDTRKLDSLRRRLATAGLPTQVQLARGADVDQPLVSRAANGELKRFTKRVERLSDYVDMRIASSAKAKRVSKGSRSGKTSSSATGGGPPVAKQALRTCREYLEDGHDPKVLIDQVAILRRVQSSGAGRTPKRSPRP